MNRVWTVLASVFAFGWAGTHAAMFYVQHHTYGVHVLPWESYLAGLIGGSAGGLVLSLMLIRFLVPVKIER